MAVEVLDSKLPLTVLGFMECLYNLGPRFLYSAIKTVDIFNKDCQTLSSVTELGRTGMPGLRLPDHNPGTAKKQLGAGGLAIAVVLGKSEHTCEPGNRRGKVLILDVRQNNVRRHGTVLQHSLILREIRSR